MQDDGGYDPDSDYTDYSADPPSAGSGDWADWDDTSGDASQPPVQSGPTADTGADPNQYAGQFADVGQTSTWDPQSGVPLGAPPQSGGGPTGRPRNRQGGTKDYSEADLGHQQWQSRRYEQCLFIEASLVGTETTSCTFIQCDFTGADLRDSVHRGTVFLSCTFREVDASGAHFEDCRFTGSVFDNVQFGSVVFHGGDLSEVALGAASLAGLNLSNIRFYGADLSGADFSGADLTNADLRNVTLNGTNFEDADLQGAALENFDLRGARLAGARIDYNQAAQLVATLGVVVG